MAVIKEPLLVEGEHRQLARNHADPCCIDTHPAVHDSRQSILVQVLMLVVVQDQQEGHCQLMQAVPGFLGILADLVILQRGMIH